MSKNNTFILTETDEEWCKALDLLGKKGAAVLATVTDPLERGAFAAFTNTLRDTRKKMFPYLPTGEDSDMEAVFGTCMAVGLIFGRSPAMLVDVLRESGAKIGILCDEGDDND